MFPRWLSWLFIAVMGYLIYIGNTANVTSTPPINSPPSKSASTLVNYPSLQQFTNADRWKRAIDPSHVGTARITETVAGKGPVAQCGNEISIRLRGTLADGANFDPAHDESKPLKFFLGNAPYAVLNQALVGMHVGGVRQISAPPQQVYPQGTYKTRDDILLRVELTDIHVIKSDKTSLGLKVIQDNEGTGDPAMCGEPLTITITLWNDIGTVAHQTQQPITITLGKDALPPALTEGLHAMRVGETRTLILPPQSNMTSTYTKLPIEIRKALSSGKITILSVTRNA